MRKKLFTITEVLIWAILFIVPMFFISTLLHPDLDIQKHYYADFRDINGVIIGSPVNYMGYNIGHVDNIQILPDRVRVDIAIVQKDYSLPPCTMVKIEEAGLGGSRSLEIFPFNNPSGNNGIYTKKPKRVSEMLNDYCAFVKNLNQAFGNVLNALNYNLEGGECCKFKDLQRNTAKAQIELDKTNANLDKISTTAPQKIKKVKENLENTLSAVQKIDVNPEEIKYTTIKNQKDLEKLNQRLNMHSAAEYRETAEKIYWKTEIITIPEKNQVNQGLENVNNILTSTQKILKKVECNLQSESLKNTREKVKNIKENTNCLIKKD